MSDNFKITDEIFDEKYQPEFNHIMAAQLPQYAFEDTCPFGGTMYETFGEELDYIKKLCSEDQGNRIWTVLEGDSGDLFIQAGVHFVNRMGYIVTKEPWEDCRLYVDED